MSIGRIESVAKQGRRGLLVAWDDGRTSAIDLAPRIAAHPQLAPLDDDEAFRAVRVSEDGWSLEWPEPGIDLGAPQLRRWAGEQTGEIMPASALRAWMRGHGFTLDAAAEALGLSRRTIAYYLSEEQAIPKTVMLATEGYDRRRAA